MPCTDGRDSTSYYENYREARDEAEKYKGRLVYAEAIICAILTQLQTSWLDEQEIEVFIKEAEEASGCDIQTFWEAHKSKDEKYFRKRIRRLLKNKSEHECKLI